MNGWYLSSTGFKSIRVGLIINGSSFKDRRFVQWEVLASHAKELLKLIKDFFNKAEYYFILFFVFKYLWMFNMPDLSLEL